LLWLEKTLFVYFLSAWLGGGWSKSLLIRSGNRSHCCCLTRMGGVTFRRTPRELVSWVCGVWGFLIDGESLLLRELNFFDWIKLGGPRELP